MPTGHPKRNALFVARRQAEVSRLALMGLTPNQIADRLKIAGRTARNDLAQIRRDWLAKARLARSLRVAEELAQLDNVERHALELIAELPRKESPQPIAQLLRVVMDCVRQRRELLGLDQPKRVEVTGSDGEPLGMEGVNAEQRQQRALARRLEDFFRMVEAGPISRDSSGGEVYRPQLGEDDSGGKIESA